MLHSYIVTVSTVTAWWLCYKFWTNAACSFNVLLNGLKKSMSFFIMEVHPEPYQIYKMVHIAKIFNDSQAFAILTESSTFDVWLASEYVSVISPCLNWAHFSYTSCIFTVGYKYTFSPCGLTTYGNLLLNSIFHFTLRKSSNDWN